MGHLVGGMGLLEVGRVTLAGKLMGSLGRTRVAAARVMLRELVVLPAGLVVVVVVVVTPLLLLALTLVLRLRWLSPQIPPMSVGCAVGWVSSSTGIDHCGVTARLMLILMKYCRLHLGEWC